MPQISAPKYPLILSDFHSLLPKYSHDQTASIRWLAEAHAQSQVTSGEVAAEDRPALVDRMEKLITRFGCDSNKIERRYSALDDFRDADWSTNKRIFRLAEAYKGLGAYERSQAFAESVNEIFRHYYAEITRPPERMIHVTCTGYISPSGAQRIVAEKNWGADTQVTHAYHMGCYASIPAVRMAQGYLATEAADARVDIVHTELCSLHMDPSQQSPEQLVVQSLFADGYMKYSARSRDAWLAETSGDSTGLEILALREEIIPNSADAMSWVAGDVGMKMTLSREVPDLISKVLPDFLSRLGITPGMDLVYAIHPGGPKIIDLIEAQLELKPEQVSASRKVLHDRGNMSSATLPHVWQGILGDPSVKDDQMIVSLAFGPGLTVSGGLFRKRSRAG